MGIVRIPDNHIDCILTDPPYLYLKNKKLDRPFDEDLFFSECKRVLKKEGFIVLFGRGTSFYRWNTSLSNLGFKFKEEIIWDKSYTNSPVAVLNRIHETISIHTIKGKINRTKIPYIEMKKENIHSIFMDIKRLSAALNNTQALHELLEFIKNNQKNISSVQVGNDLSVPLEIVKGDIPSIIRTDKGKPKAETTTFKAISSTRRIECDLMQSILFGMCEKSIIKESPNRYTSFHPTQKPVRLLERLLALTTKPGDIVLDPFAGSGSTGVACYNTGRNFICYEIDEEYYNIASARLKEAMRQRKIQFTDK
jgi:site-specific DNA-methyltransferase (adenine-specific)